MMWMDDEPFEDFDDDYVDDGLDDEYDGPIDIEMPYGDWGSDEYERIINQRY